MEYIYTKADTLAEIKVTRADGMHFIYNLFNFQRMQCNAMQMNWVNWCKESKPNKQNESKIHSQQKWEKKMKKWTTTEKKTNQNVRWERMVIGNKR